MSARVFASGHLFQLRPVGLTRDHHSASVRGRLTHTGYAASETNLVEYIRLRSNTKPHLITMP